MSGCSLVAAGLPSLVGSATPTFSYDQAKHSFGSGNNFGIQMTYMSGTSTCYKGTMPTFTPILSNPWLLYTRTCSYVTQGSPATYTGIHCQNADLWNWINNGRYTLDNYVFLNPFANTPHPFTAAFGDQPSPSTVATTTVQLTSTAINTALAPVQPAATTTVTSASATSTQTNTATVTFPITSAITKTFSVCPTSSSSSPAPVAPSSSSSSSVATTPVVSVTTATPTSSSTPIASSSPASSGSSAPAFSSSASSSPASSSITPTSASPAPSASSLSCPASNGAVFTTPQGNFIVECFIDRNNFDIGIAPNNPATYEQCIQACASTSGCQAVSYLPNGPCYLKNGLGAPTSNNAVWGARIEPVPAASSSALSTLSAGSSSQSVATTPVVSATVVTASSSSSSAASPAASVACPGSNGGTVSVNGMQYLVECGFDYRGGDIPGPKSPTYPGSYEGCLADCSSTSGCVAVSYVMNGPCYLKDSISGAGTNGNIIGGRLTPSSSTSSAPASSAAPASSSAAVSSPASVSSSIISSSSSSSSAAAASSAPVTSAAPAPGPLTVTVTTTISNTEYQCACTPTGVFATSSSAPAASPTGALSCPGSNGSMFTTSCGAVYAVECDADRFGNDLQDGLVFTETYEQCLQACDRTDGCVNVSWVKGMPGACYMKGSSGAIQNNSNIIGGRKLSGCSTLKLHRKRVAVVAPEQKLEKRAGFFGPDHTYTQARVTATSTATVKTTVTTTSTPMSGTATQTVFTLASATTTTTTSVPTTVFNTISVTTCPTASPTL